MKQVAAPCLPATPTFLVAAVLAASTLAACTKSNDAKLTSANSSKSPQALMVRVAKQAQACWFKGKDPALKPYKLATEVNSYSGKPRILIVPRNNPGGLPKLVAQAERMSGRTVFTSFGPLLDTKDGPRLNASLRAWARGSRSC